MSDTGSTDGTAAAAAASSASPAPAPSAAVAKSPGSASVTLPIGNEFQVATHHQSIADKLGAELEHIAFELVTDIENGVHKLIGTKKPATPAAAAT